MAEEGYVLCVTADLWVYLWKSLSTKLVDQKSYGVRGLWVIEGFVPHLEC